MSTMPCLGQNREAKWRRFASWLTDDLGRIADHKFTNLDELIPWRYALIWA